MRSRPYSSSSNQMDRFPRCAFAQRASAAFRAASSTCAAIGHVLSRGIDAQIQSRYSTAT